MTTREFEIYADSFSSIREYIYRMSADAFRFDLSHKFKREQGSHCATKISVRDMIICFLSLIVL